MINRPTRYYNIRLVKVENEVIVDSIEIGGYGLLAELMDDAMEMTEKQGWNDDRLDC